MKYYYLSFFLVIFQYSFAQPSIQVNGFGHLEYELYYKPEKNNYSSSFRLGEHDLFVNGILNKKISFLSEAVIRSDSKTSSGFGVSLERALIKFNYKGEHNLIVGKMHTPLNYWNDVFHHGRLFYPTIDRPMNFDFFMPIHTLGFRAQGQNLGKLNFGYDLLIGNSMETSDFGGDGVLLSYTAAFHIKPVEGMRLMAGYYHDFLPNNHHGAHSHSALYHSDYHDALTMDQFYFSFARFERNLEVLNEFAFVNTVTDSLGVSQNLSNYTYIGYKIGEKCTPFVMLDGFRISAKELHVKAAHGLKYSVGFRWEFDPKCNLKIQFENYGPLNGISDVPGIERKYELKFQLAYAF